MKDLRCKKCLRVLVRLDDDNVLKSKNVVAENIQGDAPKYGDVFNLVCKCGVRIISSDYLVEGN